MTANLPIKLLIGFSAASDRLGFLSVSVATFLTLLKSVADTENCRQDGIRIVFSGATLAVQTHLNSKKQSALNLFLVKECQQARQSVER